MFQKVLSVLIPLVRRQLEPLDCAGPIFLDLFPKQIEFAEGILGILISLIRRCGEPVNGGFYILRHIFPLEQQFAQPVLRRLIPEFRGGCEPLQRSSRVLGQSHITGKIQLAKGKGGKAVFLLCRNRKQLHRLLNVFFRALAVPIDFAEHVLSAVLTSFRRLCQPLQRLGCLLRCRG